MNKKISYSSAGVDIDAADATKKGMASSLRTDHPLVLNTIGAFSSLCDASFPGYDHPILVCKTEEPGSKQKIAFQFQRTEGICYDLINHLINDVIVMGAAPMFIQDLIVCGKIDKDVVSQLVRDFAAACTAQGAVLTGGETSEQPSIIEAGTYILGASCIGVVEKAKIIDGTRIKDGDTVLALASNGLHTNGYTLVRALMKEHPSIVEEIVGDETFLDAILRPHRCYFQALKDLFSEAGLHGLAHITGGGIAGNLNRILPEGMDAIIDASAIRILPIFSYIKDRSHNDDADMMKTFNLGVGLTVVCDPSSVVIITKHLQEHNIDCYPIGKIAENGTQSVQMEGSLQW